MDALKPRRFNTSIMVMILPFLRNVMLRASRTATLVAPPAARIAIGSSFAFTGYGKLQNIERTTQFFADLGIPAAGAQAIFVSSLELVGGIGIVLGLGTRIFSIMLLGTMAVALATADRAGLLEALQFGGARSLMDVTPIPFALGLLYLIAHGAGPLSIDRLMASMAWAGPAQPQLES